MSDLDALNLLKKENQHITSCIFFLLTVEPHKIDWFFNFWKGKEVVKIVEYTESKAFDWAVHLDLEAVGKPGEEAMLPFPWAEEHDPSIEEGVLEWRIFANT
jgi:hypothetical protein